MGGEVGVPNGQTPRREKALTAAQVRTVTEPGKYHDGGGLGLFLRVDPNGARFWVQRVTIRGKRRELGLGSPPLVTLAEARDKATANKRLAMSGGDPLEEKRKAREVLTFEQAVEVFLQHKLAEFGSEKHRRQWRATLTTYATPVIGAKPVEEIEMRDVLRVLQPIWIEKTDTANRLRRRIEAVLSWATVAGHRTGDNPARWSGNLSEMLAKPGRVAKAANQPALALAEARRWWADLAKREGMAARAVQFLALTAARSGEVRGMIWAEVDLEGALWIVPAARMKAGREHRVPLTKEAVALLRALPRMEGSPYVFFAPRGGMLSDMSLSAVMRRMQEAETRAGRSGYLDPRSGRPAVPHGLRSTFRDWAAERGYERDMAEMALAHSVGTEVERAYRRTDMLERRRAMMAAWNGHLEGAVPENVLQLAGRFASRSEDLS
jgi:integrase